MSILKISDAFEVAFITAADAWSEDPDGLDLGVTDDREKLTLSNTYPGYSPYLQIVTRGDDNSDEVTVEVCSTTNIRPAVEGGEWQYIKNVEASVAVNLSDLEAAAQAVITCWDSTL